ncbi:DoxX family protein [Muribaculaceae bacterium Isolate-002 (NCI)]|nr:DoxX family protein [Muribaculaceae bacterium Isolate-002 (NCI)]
MRNVITILFPCPADSRRINVALLALRLLFGALFMVHGLSKLTGFIQMSSTFPDPLGIGREFSLVLAIFGEVGCSILLILGLLTRLALIPMVFTMCIAFFVIHAGVTFAAKEPAFTFLLTFVILWISGAGKYSLDYLIVNRIKKTC